MEMTKLTSFNSVRNDKGMSLVSMLTAVAIGCFIVLGTTTVLSRILANQSDVMNTAEASDIRIDLQRNINKPQECDKIFKNKDYYGITQNMKGWGDTTILLTRGSQTLELKADAAGPTYINNKLRVSNVKLRDTGMMAEPVYKVINGVVDKSDKKYIAQVAMQLEKTDDRGQWIQAGRPLRFNVPVLVSGAGIIQKCMVNTDPDAVCAATGGVYVPATPSAAAYCLPNNSCQNVGAFSEPGAPNAFKNPFTNDFSCPADAQAFQSGMINASANCGKSCVGNTSFRVYECLRCGVNTSAGYVVGANPGMQVVFDAEGDENSYYNTDDINIKDIYSNLNSTPPTQPTTTIPPTTTTTMSVAQSCPANYTYVAGQGCVYNGNGGVKGGGGNCFPAGTKVTMANGSHKNIEDVLVGEDVRVLDEESGEIGHSVVTEALHHEASRQIMHTFTFEDGSTLTTNAIHLIYVPEEHEYYQAREIFARWLVKGNLRVLSETKGNLRIVDVKLSEEVLPLYNLHLKGIDRQAKYFQTYGLGHNYFADGVLVHNIKPAIP